jgi:hypothetical protein
MQIGNVQYIFTLVYPSITTNMRLGLRAKSVQKFITYCEAKTKLQNYQ